MTKKSSRHLQLLELNELTGRAKDTVKKRLRDAGIRPVEGRYGPEYPAKEALEAVIEPDLRPAQKLQEQLDPVYEKARLDRIRADKVSIEIDLLKGNLVEKNSFLTSFGSKLLDMRTAILSLPSSVSEELENQNRDFIFRYLEGKTHELCDHIARIIENHETTTTPINIIMGNNISETFE